ncbi:MAG: dihydroneopterin aldolase [Deltaproteobacteria bacterium]
MSNDLTEAFGHPELRSLSSLDAPLDRISLRDHVVDAEIGAFQEERGRRQRLNFNVVVEVLPLKEPFEDDVDRILSYDTITRAIVLELGADRLNLLETLAERIADRILTEPQAFRVFVRVEKLDRGPGALGVEIVRHRGQAGLAGGDDGQPPVPTVVFVRDLDGLSAQIDAHLGHGPLVLVPSLPDVSQPLTENKAAARRITLLALEQSAWQMAGLDDRCLVVSTRTEIDHALRTREVIVWAPSKLVLDGRISLKDDAPSAALAQWFAFEFRGAAPLTWG